MSVPQEVTGSEPRKAGRTLYWTPRILSILFLVFLALFSLDVFDMSSGPWETLLGLLMHNIPTLILTGVLIVAWKHEWLAAVVFVLAGLLYLLLITITSIRNSFEWYYLLWCFTIAGPAFLIALLFWLNWMKRRSGASQWTSEPEVRNYVKNN